LRLEGWAKRAESAICDEFDAIGGQRTLRNEVGEISGVY